MLSKFIVFTFAVFTAGVGTLFGPSSATAEPAAPEAATPPQKGTANARLLSKDEIDATIKRLASYWNPPAVKNPEEIIVRVRINLKPDGTLAGPPTVVTAGTSKDYLAARDSAVRAIFRSQPFDMLPPANYDLWKVIEITFDPRSMGKR